MKKALFWAAALLVVFGSGFTASNAYAQGAVAGTVIDAEGNGVAGAVVTITGMQHRRGERPFVARMETDENGNFGWRQVPQGRYNITAVLRGTGAAQAQIGVRDNEVTRVELQLRGRNGGGGGEEPGIGSVVGTVIDAEGNPVAGARVTLSTIVRHRGGRRLRAIHTRTDDNGAFAFEEVRAGRYMIAAFARDVGAARARLEVVADQQTEVELQLRGRR